MTHFTRAERRINRKHVLDALKDETGSSGGDKAAARVEAYRADPVGSSTTEFGYVGGLDLHRFYIDSSKPNNNERASLWLNMTQRMNKVGTSDPGGWTSKTRVLILQAIVEEA